MKNRFTMLLIALLVLCSAIASATTNLKPSISNSSSTSHSKFSAKELYKLGLNTINGYGQIKNLDRGLELISASKEVPKGRRKVAIKVVDIFGNDTTKVIEVNI